MYNVIKKTSKRLNFPEWWVEAVAIEYTNCREFGVGRDSIWSINFDLVKESELEDALQKYNTVISADIIYHNVRPEVIVNRFLDNGSSPPLTNDNGSAIVEGLASENWCPFRFNDINMVDPKQKIGSYFHVYEDGELWQWKFADFVDVEGSDYGKFISEDINLEVFYKQHVKYMQLCNDVKIEKLNKTLIIKKIDEYFKWINRIRTPLLTKIYVLHKERKNSCNYVSKATKFIPPNLSRLESYKIESDKGGVNNFKIKLDAAPMFYRSCMQHVENSINITSTTSDIVEMSNKLDTIYQEKSSALVMGIMCLEAFINQIGYDLLPDIWDNLERIELLSKIKVILKLKGNGINIYNKGEEPFNSINCCITSRNWLVHFKSKYESVKNNNNLKITPIEHHLRNDLIHNLPKRINELIMIICNATDIPAPSWLMDLEDNSSS